MTPAEIIAKLEAATEGSRELDGDIAEALGLPAIATTGIFHVQRRENREGYGLVDRAEWGRDLPTYFSWKAPEFTTSLDAALTLVPEGAEYAISTLYGLALAELPLNSDNPQKAQRRDGNVPLAICCAALKARSAA